MPSSMKVSGSYLSSSTQFSTKRSQRFSRNYGMELRQVRCDCGKSATVLTSWTQENLCRRFWRCPNYQKPTDCKYFDWVDGEMNDRAMFLILSLRNECVELKNENRELRNSRFMEISERMEIGELNKLNDLKTEIQCQQAEIKRVVLKVQTAECEAKRLVKAMKFYKILCLICIVIVMIVIFK